jgi:carbonic anhydrase
VRQNVIEQVQELRQLESVLSVAYEKGELLIVGAIYNLANGKVEFLPETLESLPGTRFAKQNIIGK